MPLLISNAKHPDLRQILRLGDRKEREKTDLYYIEGVRFVSEAAAANVGIETLVVCPQLLTNPHGRKVAARLKASGTPCFEVTLELFERLSLIGDYQGIAAVVRQRWDRLERVEAYGNPFWVAHDTVQSPGNLGTILRTCEAVGGEGAILLGNAIDPYDPWTVRGTMGAMFRLRFVRTGYAGFAAWKRRAHYRIVGTSPHAAQDYRTVSYGGPVVLFMGCEQRGMTPEQQALCDAMVRIPMVGRSDSLNLGVAAGVLLYELFNQRHRAPVGASGSDQAIGIPKGGR